MTTVTVNGTDYSDDGSSSRDMRDGGHRTFLLPMISDTMAEINAVNADPVTQNLLINPSMEIDQAHEGSSVSLATTVAQYIVDGFAANFTNASAVVSAQRASSAGDAPVGFGFSLKATVGTGASVASNDFLQMWAPLEADTLRFADLGLGSAKTLSLSWWVRASIAPYTYGVAFQNFAQTRSYVSNRTILSAGVWQQDSITFTADPTGTGSWVNSGAAGAARVFFTAAAAGAIASGSNNAWNAGNFFGASPGLTNTILSTTGATFYITGVKLEIAAAATVFTRLPPALELLRCQRYYEKSYDLGTALGASSLNGAEVEPLWGTTNAAYPFRTRFKVPKRAAPTVALWSPATGTAARISNNGAADVTASGSNIGNNGFEVTPSAFTPNAIGGAARWHWAADARL